MAESWLHEAVCRQRHEKWLIIGYIKLCVDRNMNCAGKFAKEAICRERPELWRTFGYMKVCRQRRELWGTVGYMSCM